jgi:hypothetical protein
MDVDPQTGPAEAEPSAVLPPAAVADLFTQRYEPMVRLAYLLTGAGVRLWVTAIPEGASVTKVDSLDANGTVIGAAQEIVPFSFIAPVG